jgi:putative membrane protein
MFGGGGFMLLIPLLLTVLIFFGVYMIFRRAPKRNDNLEILKIRLAKGEITIEEYENLKNHLK